tara:strand:+ start:2226 stop:2630 length:405 start_codon:yes stop_codon:yes gene_type:complete
MRYTSIVTSFLKNQEKILILKRSQNVKTMKGLWGGVSGIIENSESPLKRAKIEIFEEAGLKDNEIKLLKSGIELDIISPQYKNHKWHVFPFLFETDNEEINLNWENSDFKWIESKEIEKFQTVPSLEKVLLTLI